MIKKTNLTKRIEGNMAKIEAHASKQEYVECILMELETIRLIETNNFEMLSILITQNQKQIRDLAKQVTELKEIVQNQNILNLFRK